MRGTSPWPAAPIWGCFSYLSTHQPHNRGRSHHSLPQQLTDRKKAAKYRWKKEGSRNRKKRQQKFSTRPNFRIICSNQHGGGTEGWELSPGGAHEEHQSVCTWLDRCLHPWSLTWKGFQASLIFWAQSILLLSQNTKWNSLFHLKE